MYRDVLTHFPWTSLVLTSELIFFAVFSGSLFWIFRKGSKDFYDRLANMPGDDRGERQ
jgi:hypothetical protein